MNDIHTFLNPKNELHMMLKKMNEELFESRLLIIPPEYSGPLVTFLEISLPSKDKKSHVRAFRFNELNKDNILQFVEALQRWFPEAKKKMDEYDEHNPCSCE